MHKNSSLVNLRRGLTKRHRKEIIFCAANFISSQTWSIRDTTNFHVTRKPAANLREGLLIGLLMSCWTVYQMQSSEENKIEKNDTKLNTSPYMENIINIPCRQETLPVQKSRKLCWSFPGSKQTEWGAIGALNHHCAGRKGEKERALLLHCYWHQTIARKTNPTTWQTKQRERTIVDNYKLCFAHVLKCSLDLRSVYHLT